MSTAFLYNPKYFKLIDAHPATIAFDKIANAKPASNLLVITGDLAGDTVHVLVSQWPSKNVEEVASKTRRTAAAKANKKVMDSIRQQIPDAKILVMGDFNENPGGDDLEEVFDCRYEKERVKAEDVYNPWKANYLDRERTVYFKDEWYLPDQILVSGSFVENKNQRWKYHKNEVFNKSFLTYQRGDQKGQPNKTYTDRRQWDDGYSSHFPVIVYLIEK
jgi:hypothetical protein